MLEGWYCRTLANEQANAQQEEQNVDVDGETNSEDSRSAQKVKGGDTDNTHIQTNEDQVDYKSQYLYLKKKLKFLIYENEFFQDALRANQRRLLKVSRDRAFLLDRLLQYEKPDDSTDTEATESSEDELAKDAKKRKSDAANNSNNSTSTSGRGRKRKAPPNDGPPQKSVIVEKVAVEMQNNSNIQQPPNQIQQQQQQQQQQHQQQQQQQHQQQQQQQQGHMTAAEVERHLQSRQSVLELLPEHASATVPTEMFSNEPSLDGDPHEQMMDGSPSHVAAEECVQMEYAN